VIALFLIARDISSTSPGHRPGVRRPRALARRGPNFFIGGVYFKTNKKSGVRIVIRITRPKSESFLSPACKKQKTTWKGPIKRKKTWKGPAINNTPTKTCFDQLERQMKKET